MQYWCESITDYFSPTEPSMSIIQHIQKSHRGLVVNTNNIKASV